MSDLFYCKRCGKVVGTETFCPDCRGFDSCCLLKTYTDQIDREKKEKEDIKRIEEKALKGGVILSRNLIEHRSAFGITVYGIEKMVDKEIEFQEMVRKQAKFKEGVFQMDGSVEWREMK